MVIQKRRHAGPKGSGKRDRLARVCYRARLLPALRRLRGWLRHDLRILAYHRVLDVVDPDTFEFDLNLVSASADQFREQMLLIKRRMHPLRFDDVLDIADRGGDLPADAVIVTFDDGYDDNYRIAFPLLRELGVPATFFIPTGHVDSGLPYAYDWLVHMLCTTSETQLDLEEAGLLCPLPATRVKRREFAEDFLDQIKTLDDAKQNAIISGLECEWNMPRARHRDCRPMTWDQVREMDAGGMEIGSHGIGHRMLAKLTSEEIRAEVSGSKQALDHHLRHSAKVLSYPVGGTDAYDDRVVAATREAGYRLACSYVTGTNTFPLTNTFALRRLPVERDMSMAEFAAMAAWPEIFGHPTRLKIG